MEMSALLHSAFCRKRKCKVTAKAEVRGAGPEKVGKKTNGRRNDDSMQHAEELERARREAQRERAALRAKYSCGDPGSPVFSTTPEVSPRYKRAGTPAEDDLWRTPRNDWAASGPLTEIPMPKVKQRARFPPRGAKAPPLG